MVRVDWSGRAIRLLKTARAKKAIITAMPQKLVEAVCEKGSLWNGNQRCPISIRLPIGRSMAIQPAPIFFSRKIV